MSCFLDRLGLVFTVSECSGLPATPFGLLSSSFGSEMFCGFIIYTIGHCHLATTNGIGEVTRDRRRG